MISAKRIDSASAEQLVRCDDHVPLVLARCSDPEELLVFVPWIRRKRRVEKNRRLPTRGRLRLPFDRVKGLGLDVGFQASAKIRAPSHHETSMIFLDVRLALSLRPNPARRQTLVVYDRRTAAVISKKSDRTKADRQIDILEIGRLKDRIKSTKTQEVTSAHQQAGSRAIIDDSCCINEGLGQTRAKPADLHLPAVRHDDRTGFQQISIREDKFSAHCARSIIRLQGGKQRLQPARSDDDVIVEEQQVFVAGALSRNVVCLSEEQVSRQRNEFETQPGLCELMRFSRLTSIVEQD